MSAFVQKTDYGWDPVFKYLQFSNHMYKAELLQECIVFLIRLFARAILLMKKLKIEKIKAT